MQIPHQKSVHVPLGYGITYPVNIISFQSTLWIPLFGIGASIVAMWQLLEVLHASGRLEAISDGERVVLALGWMVLTLLLILGLHRLFTTRDELTVTHRALVFHKQGVFLFSHITYCKVELHNNKLSLIRDFGSSCKGHPLWLKANGQLFMRIIIPVQPKGAVQYIDEDIFALFVYEAVLCGQGLLKKSDMYAMKMQ